MSKAYLAWPVTLTGCTEEAHITLKYIGEIRSPAEFDVPLEHHVEHHVERLIEDISDRLALQLAFGTELDLSNTEWKPVKFNPSTHVLELHGISQYYYGMQATVATLRKEDYPGWRPHITVPKAYWQWVKREGATLGVLLERVGPLTLYVDKKPVHSW